MLFRGADKTIRNFINQDAESLANLNGYPRLAEIIHQSNPADAGKPTDDSALRPDIVIVMNRCVATINVLVTGFQRLFH